jgi:uncharacterized protein YbjT (DUF2867 family)
MILITTAGKVGAEAARLLTAQGEPVRVLARYPEKAAPLTQAGVEVVEGDLEMPASIDAAMREISSVILVSLAIPAQELNVVDSAVRAGVKHVVKITSKASSESPIARRRAQTEMEEGLIASGLGYTLLRNNAYLLAHRPRGTLLPRRSSHPVKSARPSDRLSPAQRRGAEAGDGQCRRSREHRADERSGTGTLG